MRSYAAKDHDGREGCAGPRGDDRRAGRVGEAADHAQAKTNGVGG